MSKFDDLMKLEDMLRDGLLSQAEFERFKADLLSADASNGVEQTPQASRDEYFADLPSVGGADTSCEPGPVPALSPPPRRKYLTKREWALVIAGWVLMSLVTYGVLILFGMAISGFADRYFAWLDPKVIVGVFTLFQLAGSPLPVIGWLLGVRRGFGGARTPVFIVTIVLEYVSYCALGLICAMCSGHP